LCWWLLALLALVQIVAIGTIATRIVNFQLTQQRQGAAKKPLLQMRLLMRQTEQTPAAEGAESRGK
jgi:uncharacterized membrane-anchored protein YhcB (DUF1043 family)